MTSLPDSSPSPPDLAEDADIHARYRRVYLLLAAISAPLILLLPPPAPMIIVAALAVVQAAVLADDRQALSKIIHTDLPAFASPARLYAAEIAFILAVLALATRSLQTFAPDQRLSGNEFSYLINSGVIAADVYHETGTIPLWNPYMGRGEPLIENPFSFVLNPIMTLPIFWLGAIQGTKVAVLLHIGLISVGGWLLGYVLGLKTPGRLLLALLLGGSGSFVAPLGMGFYQMSLSQAYVPWIYAGLLGIISRPEERRWTALFAVSGALLIFAGTFWYVPPTAVACGLIVGFHAIRSEHGVRRLFADRAGLLRIAFAGALLVGLATARLLPQAVHRDFIDHPPEYLDEKTLGLLDMLRVYITPTVIPPFDTPAIHYHYLIAIGFATALLFGRLLIAALGFTVAPRWRVVLPALMLIVLFTAWAQAGDFTRWLYQTVPLLREWRFVGRMLAAAAPWIAVLAALWLDQIAGVLWRVMASPHKTLPQRWRAVPRRSAAIAGVALLMLLVIAAQSANDVVANWRSRTSTETNGFLERAPLAYLREQNPDAFLAVLTQSFFGYIPFYENRIRTTFGNPDYRPLPVQPTIGAIRAMDFPAPYALDLSSLQFLDYLRTSGFEVLPENNGLFRPDVLWHNPTVPAYLFTVREDVLDGRQEPLTAADTQPVAAFAHKIDTIEAVLGEYEDGSVLVAQEVAYPGWQVSLDGSPAALESVGGLIGVRLPNRTADEPLQVVFAYRPAWLYLGAAISLVSVGVLVIFGFRLEKRLKRLRPRAV